MRKIKLFEEFINEAKKEIDPDVFKRSDIANLFGEHNEITFAKDLVRVKALLWIYKFQTEDEKQSDSTRELNGVGFTGVDGEILSSFAKQVINRHFLSEKQMVILRKKIKKYETQMSKIATHIKKGGTTKDQNIENVIEKWAKQNLDKYKQLKMEFPTVKEAVDFALNNDILFEEFLNEWDSKDVYDEPYFYKHAEQINGIYNGFNYHQMQKLMSSSSQFLMTIAAVYNLAKTDSKYEKLAEEGKKLVDPLVNFLDIVAKWENKKGVAFSAKSNHYKNIPLTLKKFDQELSNHDKLVIKDIPTDIKINAKSLLDILEFFQDVDFEENFGDEEVTDKKLDLTKLEALITGIEKYVANLEKSDLNK